MFYRDWWNANTIESYWRLWNLPVHYWMVRKGLILPKYLYTFSLFFPNIFFNGACCEISQPAPRGSQQHTKITISPPIWCVTGPLLLLFKFCLWQLVSNRRSEWFCGIGFVMSTYSLLLCEQQIVRLPIEWDGCFFMLLSRKRLA